MSFKETGVGVQPILFPNAVIICDLELSLISLNLSVLISMMGTITFPTQDYHEDLIKNTSST